MTDDPFKPLKTYESATPGPWDSAVFREEVVGLLEEASALMGHVGIHTDWPADLDALLSRLGGHPMTETPEPDTIGPDTTSKATPEACYCGMLDALEPDKRHGVCEAIRTDTVARVAHATRQAEGWVERAERKAADYETRYECSHATNMAAQRELGRATQQAEGLHESLTMAGHENDALKAKHAALVEAAREVDNINTVLAAGDSVDSALVQDAENGLHTALTALEGQP